MRKMGLITSILALIVLGSALLLSTLPIGEQNMTDQNGQAARIPTMTANLSEAAGTSYIAPDIYEPDGDFSQAGSIAFGVSQTHTIDIIGDVDMMTFTLSATRSIIIETSGMGDPDTWVGLYNAPDPYHAYWIADDNDGGAGACSRLIYEDLGPGVYYIWVQENGNDASIASYTVSLNEYVQVLDPTAPLLIDGNDDLILKATQASWPGSGSASDPFIIEGRTIDIANADSAIYIANTDLYLTLKDCTVLNASVGVRIFEAANIRLDGLTVTNGTGIMIYSNCHNIEITQCKLNSTSVALWLSETSDSVVSNNLLNGQSIDIMLTDASNNLLTGNIMEGGGIDADPGWETTCTQTIDGSNLLHGRPVFYRSNMDLSSTPIPSDASQIILGNVTNATVENLDLCDSRCGVLCSYSSNIMIRNNRLTAGMMGISLWRCDSCVVANNTLEGQEAYGISIGWSSSNVTLIDNDITGPYYGITCGGQGNHLIRNNITGSNTGIFLSYTDGNEALWNLISDCADYGMALYSSTNNTIAKNAFIGNHGAGTSFSGYQVQAYDDGTSNAWHADHSGNYWSDWSGLDQDGDGAVDQPYSIDGGGNKDRYPWAGLVDDEPVVLLVEGQGSTVVTNEASWTLAWEANDVKSGISGFFVRTDGGAWNDLGPSRFGAFQDLAEGTHALEVKGIDNAGNEVVRTLTLIVDLTPPSITVAPTSSGVSVASTVEAVFNEAVASVAFTIDGLPVPVVQTGDRTYVASITLSGYHEYNITVHAEDLAGNPAQAQWCFMTEHVLRWVNGTAMGVDGRLLPGAKVNDSFGHSAVADANGQFSLQTYVDERFLSISADGMEEKAVQLSGSGTTGDLVVTMVPLGGEARGDQEVPYLAMIAIGAVAAASIAALWFQRRRAK